MTIVGQTAYMVLWAFLILLIARLVIDWILLLARTWRPSGAIAALFEVVFSVTDPPLRFVGRFVPPLRLGNVALDMSFLLVFLAVQFGMTLAMRL